MINNLAFLFNSPHMKILAAFLFSFFFFEPAGTSVETWIIERSSNLCIEGRTNISSFTCDIVEYLNEDTILLYREINNDQKSITAKGGLSIDINGFDCHRDYLTTGFKKTLKPSENPHMVINLLTLGYIKPNTPKQHVKGYVEIQLAGVTRIMEIDYAVTNAQPGMLQLTGSRKMLFADFKLKPPKKAGGLIKVEQEITVRFQLMLRSSA